MESQLFSLPFWGRFGITFALKPTITGSDKKTQDNIDKAFKYGVIPVKLDFGSTLNLWGYEIGDALGINVLPIINLLQVDTNNIDLSKMVYYSLSFKKNVWEVGYLMQLDPLSTAAAIKNKPADASGDKNFEASDLKFVQTLGVTYRF